MSTAIMQPAYITTRYLRALWRQPYFLAITLVQPMIWLLLFGQLFKNVVQLPGFGSLSYIEFLTPGVLVMTALNSNGWSGIGYITDMDRGVMDRFLISPLRRSSLLSGQLGFQALSTVIQSLIIIGIGMLAGARFAGGALSMAAFLLCAVLLGSAMACFSNTLALRLRKQESVIALVSFLVLPLAFLSSTFMPSTLVPDWIQTISRFNPVNWAVDAGRQTLQTNPDWGIILSRLGFLCALAIVCAWMATRAFRAYQRSV